MSCLAIRYVAIINFAGRTACFESFCSHSVCNQTHLLTSRVTERSECCSADGSAGSITYGWGLVEDRLLWVVSATKEEVQSAADR